MIPKGSLSSRIDSFFMFRILKEALMVKQEEVTIKKSTSWLYVIAGKQSPVTKSF